jgi:hypothetical protein
MTQLKTEFERAYDRSRIKRKIYLYLREHPSTKVRTLRRTLGISNGVVSEILASGIGRNELVKTQGRWNADLYSLREGFDIGSIHAEKQPVPIPIPVQQPTSTGSNQSTPTIPPAPSEFDGLLEPAPQFKPSEPQPVVEPEPQSELPAPILLPEMAEAIEQARELGRKIAADLLAEYRASHPDPPAPEPKPSEPPMPERPSHAVNPQQFIVNYPKRQLP